MFFHAVSCQNLCLQSAKTFITRDATWQVFERLTRDPTATATPQARPEKCVETFVRFNLHLPLWQYFEHRNWPFDFGHFWADFRPILKHGNASWDSVYLHHLAPSSNQTKRKSDNPWLGASIGCTRCTTRSNAWRTLSNTSFYTFGGGNEGYLMLDLVISQPFQSHEMTHVEIKILKNNI